MCHRHQHFRRHLQRTYWVHHTPFILLIERISNNLIICTQHLAFSYYKAILCNVFSAKQKGENLAYSISQNTGLVFNQIPMFSDHNVGSEKNEYWVPSPYWAIYAWYSVFKTVLWYRKHYTHLQKEMMEAKKKKNYHLSKVTWCVSCWVGTPASTLGHCTVPLVLRKRWLTIWTLFFFFPFPVRDWRP